MTTATPVIMHNRYTSTLPAWWGFSFALHLLRVPGFYFALLQYGPIQAFTAAFISSMQLYRPRRKTTHMALQGCFLQFTAFYRRKYQTDTSGYNTVCATLERIHAPGRPAPIHQIPAPRRTLYRSAQPPIIIRYIRVQRCALLWIHARRRNTSQTMPARRGLDASHSWH